MNNNAIINENKMITAENETALKEVENEYVAINENECTLERKKIRLGTLCCIIGAVCWGFSGTCSQALFEHIVIDATWVTAVRMISAGVILMIYLAVKKGRQVLMPVCDRRSFVRIAVFAVAGLAFCQFAYLNAIKWSNSGTATVLQNLSVVMIALFVCLKTRSLPDKRQAGSVILATAGVWLVATGGKIGNMSLTPKGLFWGIVAAIGAVCYTLLANAPVERWGSLMVTCWGMTIGGAMMAVIAHVWNIPAGIDMETLLLLGIIVAVGTIGAFTLFLRGINLVGPVKASILGCLEPLTAAVLSAVWLGSEFVLTDIVGFVFILSTVIILRK